MSATPPNLGVAAPSSTPPAAAPPWPDATQLPVVAHSLPSPSTNPWPRPALWATVTLLVLALGVLGWNVYASSRLATRPTTLEHGAFQSSRIDLNRADRAQLMQLDGIGETLAERIEAYRDEHNGFHDVEELRQVHGIGPVLLDKIRPHVYVEVIASDEEAEPPDEPQPPAMPRQAKAKPKQEKPAQPPKKAKELKKLIDINRADAEELKHLPGIGATLSERIIETRKKAPFKKVDDLRNVPGIGAAKLDQVRPYVTVGDAGAEKKD